jgi:CDP-glucose 4,6-dehydratase
LNLECYRGQKVLVTGHTGFKGAWLTQWLLSLGAEVCGYSLDFPSEPSLFKVLNLENKINHHLGDIRNYTHLKNVFDQFQPKFAFHLAAQALVRPSYEDPRTNFETNVGGTVNVMECLRLCDSVEVAVLIASDKCYENDDRGHAYAETDALGGKDPYSASKACAEIAYHSYQRSFFVHLPRLRTASARAGNVIGGGDWAHERIIPDCVRAWSKKTEVQIRNPQSTRPWQHVLEPLGGYLHLGAALFQKDPQVVGESFNFGPLDGASKSVQTLLDEMSKQWSAARWKSDSHQEVFKKEATLLRLNCEKAKERLAWTAKLSFEESVNLTSEWYQRYYEGNTSMETLTLKQIQAYPLF